MRPSLWARGFSVHGDIQAVFDSEPPQAIEDEIVAENDLERHVLEDEFLREFGPEAAHRPSMITRTNTGKSRRDSVAPFAGLTGKLKQMFEEETDSDEGGTDIKSRLEALEGATTRIEQLLGKLCGELDDGAKRSSSVERRETGTLDDLDMSGTADIDS
jgi:hypothetical protein